MLDKIQQSNHLMPQSIKFRVRKLLKIIICLTKFSEMTLDKKIEFL